MSGLFSADFVVSFFVDEIIADAAICRDAVSSVFVLVCKSCTLKGDSATKFIFAWVGEGCITLASVSDDDSSLCDDDSSLSDDDSALSSVDDTTLAEENDFAWVGEGELLSSSLISETDPASNFFGMLKDPYNIYYCINYQVRGLCVGGDMAISPWNEP